MKFQLVLQFSTTRHEDFHRLIELEDRLIETIGDGHVVDGHDFGSGEMNIFILTDDPTRAFAIARPIIFPDLFLHLKAAYRELSASDFKTLWPPDLKTFDVI